ncbi:hypothetical protein B0H14DRAFT_2402504 [Mycena olivaceomarginata]|nr:hypothetical protein B0H14DRAFT_2402504 [Mycena olivaceomarginata]
MYRYPVLMLPSENVAEIFLHFLPIFPICAPLTGLNSPILLTQICRGWRQIALGTPRLWCMIELFNEIPWKQQKTLVDMWLSRTSCSLLSLNFDESAIHLDNVTDTLSVLFQHAGRTCISTSHEPVCL